MEIITKEELIKALLEIRERSWIENTRPGNTGGVGHTLEDLLGIVENNLPLPNAAEWELKAQALSARGRTASLTTLFHLEPSPRTFRFVPQILLPNYGWLHKEAGKTKPVSEMSFRQTINATSRSDRGFGVLIDHIERKIVISFDANAVDINRHQSWLDGVNQKIGLGELDPQPYWGFDDLYHRAGSKLLNCFYVQADRKIKEGKTYFYYKTIYMLSSFSLDKFIEALENGVILVDFDARTGHNHGTKFRMRQSQLPNLYDEVIEI